MDLFYFLIDGLDHDFYYTIYSRELKLTRIGERKQLRRRLAEYHLLRILCVLALPFIIFKLFYLI